MMNIIKIFFVSIQGLMNLPKTLSSMNFVRLPAMLEATHTYRPASETLVSKIFNEPEGS